MTCFFFWGCTSVGPREISLATVSPNMIVFVPGYYGTALVDRSSGTLRHLSMSTALFGGPSLALDGPALGLETAEVVAGGLLKKVSVFPLLFSMDIYGETESLLHDAFPKQVVTFTYDWRQSIASASARLDALIQQLKQRGASNIAIVAHSNGGMVTSYYLRYGGQALENATETWDGLSQVNAVVLAGVPFHGTVTPFYNMLHGLSFGLEKTPLHQQAFGTFPSAFELLPPTEATPFIGRNGRNLDSEWSQSQFWEKNRWGYFKDPAPSKKIAETRLHHLDKLLQRRTLMNQHMLTAGKSSPPRQIPALVIIGKGETSLAKMQWTQNSLVQNGEWKANQSRLFLEGDGTLTQASATPPPALLRGLKPQTLMTKAPHTDLLKDEDNAKRVVQFLNQSLNLKPMLNASNN